MTFTPSWLQFNTLVPLAAAAPTVKACELVPSLRVSTPAALVIVNVLPAAAPVTSTALTDVLVPATTTKPAAAVPPLCVVARLPFSSDKPLNFVRVDVPSISVPS